MSENMMIDPKPQYISDLGIEVLWPRRPTAIRCPICFSSRPVSMLYNPEVICGSCNSLGVCAGFTIDEDGHITVHLNKMEVVDGQAVFEPEVLPPLELVQAKP